MVVIIARSPHTKCDTTHSTHNWWILYLKMDLGMRQRHIRFLLLFCFARAIQSIAYRIPAHHSKNASRTRGRAHRLPPPMRLFRMLSLVRRMPFLLRSCFGSFAVLAADAVHVLSGLALYLRYHWPNVMQNLFLSTVLSESKSRNSSTKRCNE